MMKVLVAYLTTGAIMLVMDVTWLSTMIGTYRRELGDMLYDGVRMGPALAFYLLYVAGVVGIVVLPTLRQGGSVTDAALMGAMLGLVAYGTYDLTNHATLRSWSAFITVMDMAWGTALTGISAAVGTYLTQRFAG